MLRRPLVCWAADIAKVPLIPARSPADLYRYGNLVSRGLKRTEQVNPAWICPAGRSRPDPGGSGCGVIPYSAGGRGHGPAVVAAVSMRRHVAPPSAVA